MEKPAKPNRPPGKRPAGKESAAPRGIRELQRQLEMYRLVFDSIYNGCLVTDAKGTVTHFNKPYGEFLGP